MSTTSSRSWRSRAMQPSELFRRGVVVPRTAEAEQRLMIWDVEETTPVDVLPLDDERVFLKIKNAGVFLKINEMFGSIIDDYEQEVISWNQCAETALMLEREYGSIQDGDVCEFCRALAGQCMLAARRKLALFFVL